MGYQWFEVAPEANKLQVHMKICVRKTFLSQNEASDTYWTNLVHGVVHKEIEERDKNVNNLRPTYISTGREKDVQSFS